jgi:hypothetical protein
VERQTASIPATKCPVRRPRECYIAGYFPNIRSRCRTGCGLCTTGSKRIVAEEMSWFMRFASLRPDPSRDDRLHMPQLHDEILVASKYQDWLRNFSWAFPHPLSVGWPRTIIPIVARTRFAAKDAIVVASKLSSSGPTNAKHNPRRSSCQWHVQRQAWILKALRVQQEYRLASTTIHAHTYSSREHGMRWCAMV